ncbi:hypothetical protein LSAT2_020259 [Lamellibrachia satsuma]|nr:hypothetical protein LSAT2_020259 [Lamellibrachia satsuma]
MSCAHPSWVLILGGSGGIGTFATQLLKAWGATVTVTCAPDAVAMTLALGADIAISYHTSDIMEQLKQLGGFDFVLDTVGKYCDGGCRDLLQPRGTYVTLLSPLMYNTDKLGLGLGLARSAATLSRNVTQGLVNEGKHYRWAFFTPSRDALDQVARLVDQGKLRPVVEEVYPFRELPKAYKKVSAPHSRGKTVLSFIECQ